LDRDHRVDLALGDDDRQILQAGVPQHVEVPELLRVPASW
jgi:hypothetical protein